MNTTWTTDNENDLMSEVIEAENREMLEKTMNMFFRFRRMRIVDVQYQVTWIDQGHVEDNRLVHTAFILYIV